MKPLGSQVPHWWEATGNHTLTYFIMSTLEVRALQRAKEDFARARKQLEVARLRATAYRGVVYDISAPESTTTNKEFTYRGVGYTN